MGTPLAVALSILLGVWLIEAVLFLLSYRYSGRAKPSRALDT